ncbi:MAG: transcription antitermination factor NusB [Lentimicrobiaceae bacterium]|nr:transcription antitermination factor NusB [Lentimicrobiaceae bacterium]
MISRNTIRIKVMQALYEYRFSSDTHIDTAEKKLMQTFDNFYNLYLQLLALFGYLTYTAEQTIEAKMQRLLPDETDLQPNYKFAKNLFVKKLEKNISLQNAWRKYNIGWSNDIDIMFIRKTYEQITHLPVFVNYMQNHSRSFDQDKAFIIELVESFLLENEDLCNYFGEKNLHWLHDYNDAVILVYNTLKQFTENQKPEKALPTLFKTNANGVSEDQQFTLDLFRKTIKNNKEYTETVIKKLLNWEIDRVACMDFILLKMAVCEFCEFPTIPIRVTLNEYIEISKYYSTHKSKNFINGMLDNILLDLKKENKINKQGRGLKG